MNKYEKRHHGQGGEYSYGTTRFHAVCAIVGAVSATMGYLIARHQRLQHQRDHFRGEVNHHHSPSAPSSFPRAVGNRRYDK